jgi:hypothetical protein
VQTKVGCETDSSRPDRSNYVLDDSVSSVSSSEEEVSDGGMEPSGQTEIRLKQRRGRQIALWYQLTIVP